jgi:hypothetical protein
MSKIFKISVILLVFNVTFFNYTSKYIILFAHLIYYKFIKIINNQQINNKNGMKKYLLGET